MLLGRDWPYLATVLQTALPSIIEDMDLELLDGFSGEDMEGATPDNWERPIDVEAVIRA